jgi:hypothetical protein
MPLYSSSGWLEISCCRNYPDQNRGHRCRCHRRRQSYAGVAVDRSDVAVDRCKQAAVQAGYRVEVPVPVDCFAPILAVLLDAVVRLGDAAPPQLCLILYWLYW